MLINLSELFICQGKEKTYILDIESDRFQVPGAVLEIRQKEPVVFRIQNIGERTLELEGKACLTLLIPCGRCLELVPVEFDLEIIRTLDMKLSEEERIEELDEQPYLSGYNLDVDRLVCNELLLNLPIKVLCSEVCKGICNQCGTNLNMKTCGCDDTSPNLQMSAIQDIFKQFKEV